MDFGRIVSPFMLGHPCQMNSSHSECYSLCKNEEIKKGGGGDVRGSPTETTRNTIF